MTDLLLKYWWQVLLLMVGSYFIGAINFSLIFSKLIKKEDIRNSGSGNPGTTNMFRVYGLKMGLLTFLFDGLKGFVCCIVSHTIIKAVCGGEPAEFCWFVAYLSGVFVVMGHIFPVFLKFRGGKGVATSIGVCFYVHPIVAACCVIPCILLIIITDRMSVMSLTLALFFIVLEWIWAPNGYWCAGAFTAMFCLLIFAHRHNIKRLLTGKELPTGVRKAFKKNKEN